MAEKETPICRCDPAGSEARELRIKRSMPAASLAPSSFELLGRNGGEWGQPCEFQSPNYLFPGFFDHRFSDFQNGSRPPRNSAAPGCHQFLRLLRAL
eukprot:scaffold995_cov244-Pinguiococcus_pyrenoidosus.AAC.5